MLTALARWVDSAGQQRLPYFLALSPRDSYPQPDGQPPLLHGGAGTVPCTNNEKLALDHQTHELKIDAMKSAC